MDTIVNIPGGNPRGRSKYYLNDALTIKKLKAAAKEDDIKIKPCQNSMQIQFNVGSYVEVALVLLKYWESCEGQPQIPEDVDNLDVKVLLVETVEDAKGINERHIVRLSVEGEQVTVTLWDTKCKMGVQAAAQLVPYTDRVLFPYLREKIREHQKKIKERNEQVLTHGEDTVMTRHKRQQELVKNAAILESPIRSVAPFSGTIEDSPAPVRLLNQLLTWVSTPARPSEEKEQEKEKERDNEQEKEQVQEATPPEDVRLALTYSPPKEQQDNNSSPARQEVACFPCNICDNVFFNEDNLNSHVKGHTVVPPPRSEGCPLTASGRLLLLTPTFGSKHLKFQEALNNDHIEVFDDSSDEEDNDGQQTCKVCKKTVKMCRTYKITFLQSMDLNRRVYWNSSNYTSSSSIQFWLASQPSWNE